MIERQTINGRKAKVSYLDDKFRPVHKDSATVIKIVFDDGEITFAFLEA